MPTEEGKAAARAVTRKAMAGEPIQALAKRAKVDPQTLGDFLGGRRWPIASTLGKIEAALGLTPGTLAALGEDAAGAPAAASGGAQSPSLREASDEQLLAELGWRMVQLRRAVERDGVEPSTQASADDPGVGLAPLAAIEPAPEDYSGYELRAARRNHRASKDQPDN